MAGLLLSLFGLLGVLLTGLGISVADVLIVTLLPRVTLTVYRVALILNNLCGWALANGDCIL